MLKTITNIFVYTKQSMVSKKDEPSVYDLLRRYHLSILWQTR